MTSELWQMVADNWGDLRELLCSKLDTTALVMFDDDGNLIPSERPMMESIICDFTAKLPRFRFYLGDLISDDSFNIEETSTGRIINIGLTHEATLHSVGDEECLVKS